MQLAFGCILLPEPCSNIDSEMGWCRGCRTSLIPSGFPSAAGCFSFGVRFETDAKRGRYVPTQKEKRTSQPLGESKPSSSWLGVCKPSTTSRGMWFQSRTPQRQLSSRGSRVEPHNKCSLAPPVIFCLLFILWMDQIRWHHLRTPGFSSQYHWFQAFQFLQLDVNPHGQGFPELFRASAWENPKELEDSTLRRRTTEAESEIQIPAELCLFCSFFSFRFLFPVFWVFFLGGGLGNPPSFSALFLLLSGGDHVKPLLEKENMEKAWFSTQDSPPKKDGLWSRGYIFWSLQLWSILLLKNPG